MLRKTINHSVERGSRDVQSETGPRPTSPILAKDNTLDLSTEKSASKTLVFGDALLCFL